MSTTLPPRSDVVDPHAPSAAPAAPGTSTTPSGHRSAGAGAGAGALRPVSARRAVAVALGALVGAVLLGISMGPADL